MKAFILTINPANGILSDTISNTEIEYSTQNIVAMQKGDMVLGYIAYPVGQIRMIFEASKSSAQKKIFLYKQLDVAKGVNASDFQGVQSAIDNAESQGNDVVEITLSDFEQAKNKLIESISRTETNPLSLKERFTRFIQEELGLSSIRQVNDLEMISDKALAEGAIQKPVYSVDDIEEYRDLADKIRNSESYIDYKTRRKEKNKQSGLACDQGMTNYEKFLKFLGQGKNQTKPINPYTGCDIKESRNKIYFGAPGTGKSFKLNEDRVKKLHITNENEYERVTFHPDYSYANFVGTYKPIPFKDSTGKESITYEYVPGPFMRILVKALKGAQKGEKKPYLLIIEEINRANVAAVFGDVFQLLDRTGNGVSEYHIQTSEDIRNYLAKPENLGGEPNQYNQLKMPDNLFIWATMNSADQGVFPLDTAFKRRWDFEYIGIDDSESELVGKTVIVGGKEKQRIEWNSLRKAINDYLAENNINEDKQLGPYFISRDIVVPENGNEIDPKEFGKVFKNKVIMYLFEDAGKRLKDLFGGVAGNNKRYSEICKAFDIQGIGIFNGDIQNFVNAEDIIVNGYEGGSSDDTPEAN